MSSIQLFDLNGEQRFTGTSVGGGGAQPSTLTATLTTDPSSFVSPVEIFDLGGVAVAYLTALGTVFNADGETWDTGIGTAGAITVDAGTGVNGSAWSESRARPATDHDAVFPDGISVFTIAPNKSFVAPANGWNPTQPNQEVQYVVPGFISVVTSIVWADTFALYDGSNHPTATLLFMLEYR